MTLQIQPAILPKWTFSYEPHPFPYLDSAGDLWTFPACTIPDAAQRLNGSKDRKDRALIVDTEKEARRLKAVYPTVRFMFPCTKTQVEIHDCVYTTQFFEVVETE